MDNSLGAVNWQKLQNIDNEINIWDQTIHYTVIYILQTTEPYGKEIWIVQFDMRKQFGKKS